jgi:hypothetical protein
MSKGKQGTDQQVRIKEVMGLPRLGGCREFCGSRSKCMEFGDLYKISSGMRMDVQAAENANGKVLYSEDFSNGHEYEAWS